MMNTVQFNENNLSVNEGVVRVYDSHPQTHEYLGFSDEYLAVGLGLPAHSCVDEPPQPKTGFAICRIEEQWQYVADYRGQVVYDKKTAQPETITELGELPEHVVQIKPETEFDYWDGQGWRTNVEAQKQQAIALADVEKQNLQTKAENELAILQRAVKLELATPEELALLEQWERYSVLLNRIDTNNAPDIHWPEIPR